jgi:hypothetical protein
MLAGLASLGAIGLLAAGCGTSAESAFGGRFAPLDDQVSRSLRSATGTLANASSESDAQLANSLDPVTSRLQGLIGKLGALSPPASVKADYTDLVRELGQVNVDLTGPSSAVRGHDVGSSRTAALRYVSDMNAVTTTDNELRKTLGLHRRG